MATPLDIATLKPFEGIFPFLFVLVVVYAILANTDYFKDRQVTAAILSVLAAFIALFSPIVMKTVALSMPWFVLFLFFILMMMLVFMATGVSSEGIAEFIKGGTFSVGIWIMAIMLIIFLGSLLTVWTEESGGPAQLLNNTEDGRIQFEEGSWNIAQTIHHPQFLGLALVLLLALFTIKYLASKD